MRPITIYVKTGCAYSAGAKRLLSEKGLEFEELNITGDERRKEEMVRRAGGRTTTPQIFFGDRHIGGFEELQELDRTEGLRSRLGEAGADAP